MSTGDERFEAYLRRDDGIKTYFLNLISGSYHTDGEAIAELNREYATPQVTAAGPVQARETKFAKATIREWVRGDERFAEALKVARQMRVEGLAFERKRKAEPQLTPEQWPLSGRLDLRDDPYRVSAAPAESQPYRDRNGVLRSGSTMEPLQGGLA
jgi:hypothetical protein